MQWYIDPNVNHRAVECFFETMAAEQSEVHTLQIYHGGKRVVRIAQEPYSCTDVREVYSLSKTFTSTVVGIAADQGYLTPDDKVAEILGKTGISEYFDRMTVRHVLSMNTGHERCVMEEMAVADCAVDAFFSIEPKYEPGTHFTYNTGATCLLSAIVEKVTGMDFFDYACQNLFYPLGITNVYWTRCHDGTCVGGAGLHISSDDIVKLGLMYQNGGIYQGKRIVSQKWIEEASSAVSDTTVNETRDWRCGYGYQIWRNDQDGYRGDGAFGQMCLVLPKYDMVIVIQTLILDTQKEMDALFRLADDLLVPGGECREFSFMPLESDGLLPQMDTCYCMEENPAGIRSVHLVCEGNGLQFTFNDAGSMQTITAEIGSWTMNSFTARHMVPTLHPFLPTERPEPVKVAACCAVKDGRLVLCLRYKSNPHTEWYEMQAEETELRISISSRVDDLRPVAMRTFSGKKQGK